MIKLDRANYLLSDIELLNDIASQLYDNAPNERVRNTAIIAEFVAPATYALPTESMANEVALSSP